MTTLSPTDTLEHGFAQLGGTASVLHLPGTHSYDAAVAAWNVAVARRPVAVVDATCADDVVAAVRLARRCGLRVSVQATGHGAAGDLDGLLLVSTRRMTGLRIDPDTAIARVEAGVTWAAVLEAGAPHGLAGLAGSAPGVGVVGYTTGGGAGPLARTLGLASDRVRAFDVVTGDGELRRATPTENPELFWGLRGGKGLLGIVTALEFELLPIAEIYGGAVYFDGADAHAVLHAWAAWSTTLPREATTSVALLRLPALPGVPPPLAGRLTVAVRFAWTGDHARGAQVLAPVRAVAAPIVDTVAPMPYAALGVVHADPVDPMPTHEAHAMLGRLDAAAVDAILAAAGPQIDAPQIIVELRQLGGAVADVTAATSAVGFRDGEYSLLTIGLGVPPAVGAVAAHARGLTDALAPWSTGFRMPNFAPGTDGAWLRSVHDAPTLHRLARAAEAYDPDATIAGCQHLRPYR
ncbi:FAD-binding oxidoreductase [Jatrophihabitans fulvus]